MFYGKIKSTKYVFWENISTKFTCVSILLRGRKGMPATSL
jgi:hypothetical protein